jgi:outer membrane protein
LSREIVLLIVVFLLLLPISSGAEGDVLSITTDDALELALSNNLDIKAGLAALETAKARVKSSDNFWNPRFTATYSYTRLDEAPDYQYASKDNSLLGVQFTWPLYTGGEREASVDLAELAVEGLEAQQQVLEDITGVLAQNYCLNLREARGQIVAREKSLEYINGLLKTSQAFYDEGLIPKNELLRVQVEQMNRALELESARNNERLSQDELNAFIGFDFGTQLMIEVLGYEPFFYEITDLDPFFELALRQRPEMVAVGLQYQMLDEERKMAKSGRLPDVNLIVSYERAGDSLFLSAIEESDPDTVVGMVQVSYDLWDGGGTSDYLSELDRREKELDIAKMLLEQDIYLELEEAYLSIKQAYGEITTTGEAIASADENLRITRRRFEEGLAVSNDVIEAEALLLSAQLSNTHAIYNYYRAAAFVGKAVGVADMKYYIELKDKLGL